MGEWEKAGISFFGFHPGSYPLNVTPVESGIGYRFAWANRDDGVAKNEIFKLREKLHRCWPRLIFAKLCEIHHQPEHE